MTDTSGSENRTERATPRRLEKAREEGSVVRAHGVAGAAVLLAGAAVLLFAGAKLGDALQLSVQSGLQLDPEAMRDPARLLVVAWQIARPGLMVIAPFLALTVIAAFLADVLIGGWTLSTRPLTPDLSRINPLKGFGRLFSHAALAEIAKALIKFVVIAIIAWWLIRARVDAFTHIATASWPVAAHEVAGIITDIFIILALCLAAVSLLEVPYQFWAHYDRLKMTRQEIKDEMRELDGSPQTRRRIRGLRIKMARMRMMTEVPKADVVLVNPEHFAAALSYNENTMRAPRLVAKGTGLIALRIREVAAEHKVPVIEAPPLTRALCRFVELGDEIPTGLYGVIAEVLAYVYRLKLARDTGSSTPEPPKDGRFEPPAEFSA
jgi:flagellar biosynthetic protein FlhB